MTSMRWLGGEIMIEYVGSIEEMSGYWVCGMTEVSANISANSVDHTMNG